MPQAQLYPAYGIGAHFVGQQIQPQQQQAMYQVCVDVWWIDPPHVPKSASALLQSHALMSMTLLPKRRKRRRGKRTGKRNSRTQGGAAPAGGLSCMSQILRSHSISGLDDEDQSSVISRLRSATRLAFAHHALAASAMRDDRLSATAFTHSDEEEGALSDDGAEDEEDEEDEGAKKDDAGFESTTSSRLQEDASSTVSSLLSNPWSADFSRRQSSI
jgi:hypothetical protein